MKKINWKQPKYIIPLVISPFIFFIGYKYNGYQEKKALESKVSVKQEVLSTDLGTVENSEIKGKSDAYQEFFDKRTDGRTMISGVGEEEEIINEYGDNLSLEEKRYIDSLNFAKDRSRLTNIGKQAKNQQKYYSEDQQKKQADRKREDEQYDRSMKMLEMLNGNKNQQSSSKPKEEPVKERNYEQDQMSLMREQMMLMDSIERTKNPELMAQDEANNRLKQSQEDLEMFLNSTLKVTKSKQSKSFNSIYKIKESSFV